MFLIYLCYRLQNQNVHQSQPQSVEAETKPGSSKNDPGEAAKSGIWSAQQEVNWSMLTSSPGPSPKGSPLSDPLSHGGPSRPAKRKHSAENKNSKDDSLDWFDSIATHQLEPQNTAPVSPKTNGGKMALQTFKNKAQGKKKGVPGQRSKMQTGQLPAPGETEASRRPDHVDHVEGKEAKKAAVVPEAAGSAGEPDSVLTHHVSRKLHQLRKASAQELCRNPATVPVQPVAPSHPRSSSLCGPKGALETPKRKRQKFLAQMEEPELGSAESPGPPLAKLAKFTFKQKSKLTHSPEDHSPMSPGTTKGAVPSPRVLRRVNREAVVPGKGPQKLASTSGSRNSDQQQDQAMDVSQQALEEDSPREKSKRGPEGRVTQPEFELGNQTGRSPPTCQRDRKEEVSRSIKSSKVHACTLAKLAHFSFTSPSESKSESPPPPESENEGVRGTSPRPGAAATVLGRKRKTFQLEGSSERLFLSKKSLFTLSELDDEALDFDWNEEIRRKP